MILTVTFIGFGESDNENESDSELVWSDENEDWTDLFVWKWETNVVEIQIYSATFKLQSTNISNTNSNSGYS